MFKATISTNVLQNAMKALTGIIDECIFEITSDGLAARAVDASNSAMVSLDLPANIFNGFAATDGEIGVDTTRFVAILAMADRIDEVNLEIDEHTHKLNIEMGELSYTMALIDPSTMRKAPSIPQLDLPAEITLSGVDFRRAIKAATMAGDHLRLGVSGEMFYMEASGDGDKVRLELTREELIGLKAADVDALYALDYLTDVAKGIGNASEIVINLGRDLPVVITFDAAVDCPVVYILAPRIESD